MTDKLQYEDPLKGMKIGSKDWLAIIESLLSVATKTVEHGPLFAPITNVVMSQLRDHSKELEQTAAQWPVPGQPVSMQSGPNLGKAQQTTQAPLPTTRVEVTDPKPHLSPDPEPGLRRV